MGVFAIKRTIIIFIIILFVLLTTIVFSNNYKEKGTFEELVVNKFLSKAKSKEIDSIKIENFSQLKIDSFARSNNVSIINEFLSKFNGFELIEYDKVIPTTDKDTYGIKLRNTNTNEYIYISTEGDRYLRVRIRTLLIKENKKDKITKYEHDNESHVYKITNGNIDFDYLNALYNSLHNKSVR